MSEDSEIDPEMLRREVDQIKDAMGLQERYPSQFRLWLVFGVLVALASAGSQVIYLRDLSGSLHTVVWFGLLGVGWVYQWSSGETDGGWSATGTKPRIGVLWASVFALYFVFVFTLGPAIDEVGGPESDMLLFSLVVGLVGVAYLVVGEALRAYYIRRRDRFAFYVGGAWMLVLAALLPSIEFFHTWGYATFGVVYAAHAVVSYLLLR
ncbi:hypothetical protein BRC87_00705 [Halobacteriales archaeon QS_4_66_20]|jgi:hypothetical protein|nr:MAG: hypothetical protein BRC87_00705 [Halobacteriales archaeon QS_4_66_20]